MPAHGNGPVPARLMIVGEHWGAEELRAQQSFTGNTGRELDRMLNEVGILRSEAYLSNLINAQPPGGDIKNWIPDKKKNITAQHVQLRNRKVMPIIVEGYEQLKKEIEFVKPNVILAAGNAAMWALTENWGIMRWRGSLLGGSPGPKIIPTVNPAAVLREWKLRPAVIRDLRRVADHIDSREYNPPAWQFIIRPSFTQTIGVLDDLHRRLESATEPLWIDFDIETRAGHTACAGISWSLLDALCIPLMCVERRDGYWNTEEEATIIWRLRRVLTHPKAYVRAQNGLYDLQYTWRHWHFIPNLKQDTMISWHSTFSSMPKRLDFQASMHCEHFVYWKDDGKTWAAGMGEDQLWHYNLLDCVRTRECGESELAAVKQLGLESVDAFQQSMFYPVLRAMNLGIRVDKAARNDLATEIESAINDRQDFLTRVLGHSLLVGSHPQMTKLFYEDLKQQPNITRAKKGIPGHLTCDDEALQKIVAREPLLRPIVNAISDIRTLQIFLKTFVLMKLDYDDRARCSFNICGTNTYRLSSSKSAFDSGANLQTIPSDKSKSVGKSEARSAQGGSHFLSEFKLPNIRRLFIPDVGFTFFDLDLDRADLQVVAWEANDLDLKSALRLGADLHLLNAFILDSKEAPPYEELVESHPKYPDHRGPRKHSREFAKVFCHGTNYGGSSRTMAAHTGRSVGEVERCQRIWFGAHPGIKSWQDRTRAQVMSHRFVQNKFGYRWYIFDRVDTVLGEALAWVPQSTVGVVINKIWKGYYDNLPEIQVLLQLHDSLGGQLPTHRKAALLPRMKELAQVVIPYDDPLIIPVGIELSEKSWGQCGEKPQ